eukprot:TRINITY_DN5001_c0_g1_i12.p1 TRINITY_DN5001_c0_g1~~TRINITY_DN5001_c0_g1_i12.p1  ORF type:complete len:107 (+),score=30.21 TRINITY_DN5001_c0_g1_i12:101-421(+)
MCIRDRRREIKFALKRGEKVNLKRILTGEKEDEEEVKVKTKGKFGEEDFKRPDFTFTALKPGEIAPSQGGAEVISKTKEQKFSLKDRKKVDDIICDLQQKLSVIQF